jgi:hypothetical protein
MELRKDETLVRNDAHSHHPYFWKEVAVMATTKPGTALVRYRKKAKKKLAARRDSVKSTDAVKRWAFPIVLLVATCITWIVLFVVGMASGAFGVISYPGKLAGVVTVFHVVIFAWPTYLLVKQKAWWRLIVVGIMVLGMGLALLFGYIVAVGAPLWGLRVLGVAALILSAVTAYLLSRYPEEDQEYLDEVKLLPAHDRSVEEQRETARIAGIRAENATQAADLLKKDHSDAAHEAEQASKDRTAKQKAYDNSDAVKEMGDIKKELDAKKVEKTEIADKQMELVEKMSAVTRSARKPKPKAAPEPEDDGNPDIEGKEAVVAEDSASKPVIPITVYQRKYDELERRHKELEETVIPDLEQKFAEATQKAEDSKEKEALDEAVRISEAASDKEREKRAEHKRAKKSSDKKTQAWKHEEDVLADLTSRRDEVSSKQQTTNESRRQMWRDDLMLPLIYGILALLCYPAWYGWVLLEVR